MPLAGTIVIGFLFVAIFGLLVWGALWLIGRGW